MEDPRLAQLRALCDRAANGVRSPLASQLRKILDAPPVAVTPPQGIDRDALLDELQAFESSPFTREHFADRILALVRPVEGVTLTPEEAVQARGSLRADALEIERGGGSAELVAKKRALAARLEALR